MKIKSSAKTWKDADVELIVGQLLRYGVLTATLVAFIGGFYYLAAHGAEAVPAYSIFKGEGAGYTTYGGIINGALALKPREVIQLGVLLLIATPVLRIVFSLIGFVMERDKMYIIITLIVLTIMMTSIFGGLKL